LLGHVSAQTTEKYAHHDPGHLIHRAIEVRIGGDKEKEK
jgi:hypothetical protein